MKIRLLRLADNKLLADAIRDVLLEMTVPAIGTAFADRELHDMYQTYLIPRSIYYVVESEKKILGGAGIMPLNKGPEHVCELQKMYIRPSARGMGIGFNLLNRCLSFAKKNKFTVCYLETMPNMLDAQKLYKKNGFEYIDNPMGDTGHFSCPVWMTRKL